MKVCRGCGESLQSEAPGRAGYVPPHRLEGEDVLCQRCYRIVHYNEVAPAAVPQERLRDLFHRLATERCLVVQVADVVDWTGSKIPDLPAVVGPDRLWLVVNKVDLLPPETSYDRVRRWFEQQLRNGGVAVERVFLASAAKGIGLGILLDALRTQRVPVYFTGAANVGKSSLINGLLRLQGRAEGPVLTTSRVPGTTLNTVTIELEEGRHWIDTPGLTAAYRVVDRLCPLCLKSAVPRERIRPRIYQLQAGQSLWIGGLVRLDVLEGERQPFVCYVSNGLPFHRTKVERSASYYESHVGRDLVPPCPECRSRIEPFAETERVFSPGPATDVAVAGLGWISVRGRRCRAAIRVPEGVDVEVRPAFL